MKKNEILMLKNDEGVWVLEKKEIHHVILNYCKNIRQQTNYVDNVNEGRATNNREIPKDVACLM